MYEAIKFYCPKDGWATEKNTRINGTMEEPNGNSGGGGSGGHTIQVTATATTTIPNEMMEWPI